MTGRRLEGQAPSKAKLYEVPLGITAQVTGVQVWLDLQIWWPWRNFSREDRIMDNFKGRFVALLDIEGSELQAVHRRIGDQCGLALRYPVCFMPLRSSWSISAGSEYVSEENLLIILTKRETGIWSYVMMEICFHNLRKTPYGEKKYSQRDKQSIGILWTLCDGSNDCCQKWNDKTNKMYCLGVMECLFDYTSKTKGFLKTPA